MEVTIFILGYLIITNLSGLFLMWLDKRKAVKHAFRIPEGALFLVAIIGGSLGSIVGMHIFHHKTRKWYFRYGMPLILLIQIAAVLLLISSPIEFITL